MTGSREVVTVVQVTCEDPGRFVTSLMKRFLGPKLVVKPTQSDYEI